MHSDKEKEKIISDENKERNNEMKSGKSYYTNECHKIMHKNLDCKYVFLFPRSNACNNNSDNNNTNDNKRRE